ncbi:MAG: SDR family NAD(P)-dependent oxidoreductase [Planctomycetes bacterium]|nr:SDR family NAD(P)-dependent oxidoreductase [Planctomycetota bacterium]
MTETRVWWITGASSGLGQALAERAASAGHVVVASARRSAPLAAWCERDPARRMPLALDVDDGRASARATEAVIERWGRIDVLVNNAGYGLVGGIEETSDAEARSLMETNFFGALTLTREVLPHMRRQRYGRIVQMSSVAGIHASPGFGLYNASKFALEGFSEALSLEVAHLGIRVVIVEPGPFRTNFAGSALRRAAQRIDDYGASVGAMGQRMRELDGTQAGDPAKAAEVLLEAIASASPPLRLPLGRFAHQRTRDKASWLVRDAEAWRERSLPTEFGD